jgi:protocatechuate 3,4-dioxygenase beta subunit
VGQAGSLRASGTRALLPLLLALTAQAQITGRVADAVSGRPIIEATVILQSPTDSYIVETDGEGAFRIDPVAPGRYEVTASREGFAAPRRPTRITVEAATPALNLRLVPLAVITGRVTDRDGDPVAEAYVETLRTIWVNGARQLRAAATTRTNDRGEYRLFGLPPGRYRLRASQTLRPIGASSRYMTIRGDKLDLAYPAVYFPSDLDLAAGAELRDINVQLQPQSLHRIRVTAVKTGTAEGRLVIGLRDLAQDSGSMGLSGPGYGKAIALPPSKPGRYLVSAEDREQNLRAQQVVTLTDSDVDVTLTPAPEVSISGTFKLAGEGRVAFNTIGIHLDGEDPWNQSRGSVQADGRFTVGNLQPAAYRFRTTLPTGVYLHSIRRGDRLLESPRLDLTQNNEPLIITLATDGGTIEGAAPEDAVAVLAPVGRLAAWPDSQRIATATKDGRFQLRDIAPGEYLLFVFDDAEPGAPAAAEFRAPYVKQATPVSVEPGSRQKVEVKTIAVQP